MEKLLDQKCYVVGCTKLGTIPVHLGSHVSMTSTSTQSSRTEMMCKDCAAQEERMNIFNK